MKKVLKSAAPPPALNRYFQCNPRDDWNQFHDNDGEGYKEVKRQLRLDQRCLCAYCEIDLAAGEGKGLDDFRVEHFYPKNPHNPPPNHSLDWHNIIAVCTGGNFRSVTIKERFTSPDTSCDVPKGNHNWTDMILNPLTDIPAFPRLFRYEEHTGAMAVDESTCPPHLIPKAEMTILKLRLSPAPTHKIPTPRLHRFRKAVLDKLREEVARLLADGLDEESAAQRLAEENFSDNPTMPFPAFFTCIRWYLGAAAEARLRNIGHQG